MNTMRLRRPHIFILMALVILPLAFQNCGESFFLADGLNMQGKGNGGNGGGYDGKPGTYVLADLGGECAGGDPTHARAKQVIVVDEAGGMSRTVRDCQTLPVPEPVRASDLHYNAKSAAAFVADGRLFQRAALEPGGRVARSGLTEILCSWNRGAGLRGEARLRNVRDGVGGDGVSGPAGGEPPGLYSELFEEQDVATATQSRVSTVDVTPASPQSDPPDPYDRGMAKIYESAEGAARTLLMSGLFFADRAAEAAVVQIDGETQSGTRCWMAY